MRKEVWQDDGTGQKNVTAYAKDFLEADGTTSSSVIDANGNMSKEYFNAEGYKLRTADLGDGTVSPITTKYEYDDKGNTSKETYGDGTYKTFQYDAGGRMTLEQCFKAGGNQTLETRYTYSDLGQLLTMEDFQVKNGQKSRYRYTAYTYDGLGQIISTVEYSGSNVPDEEALEKHRMKYSYDLGGRLAEITYPSARDSQIRAVKYVYDGNGRKTGVDAVLQDGSEKVVARYQYTAIGNLDTETVYRGFLDGASDKVLYKKYQYDALSRVTQVSCYDSAAMQNCLDTYKYSYDKNFRIVTEDIVCQYPGMERVDELRSYEYDGLGRLKKMTVRDRAAGCSRETAYTYDKVGHMLTEAEGNMTKHMAYNSLNQMVSSITVRGGKQESQCAYTYDSRGNLVRASDPAQGTIADSEYNIRNQMEKRSVSVRGQLSVEQENLYNGNGQRVQKKEGGDTADYYYQGSTVYAVTDGADALRSLHVLNGEKNVLASLCCQGESAGKCFFYGKDGRNSTLAVLRDDGDTAWSYRYGVFGETEVSGTELFSEFCYTGSVYDSSTGLYYLDARYYDPTDRRFLTQDSYRGDAKEPYSLNLYAYCANDPVNRVDVEGHRPQYITEQTRGTLVDGKYMKDIKIGFFGNVGDNGCGAIAVYNVMVANGYERSFIDLVTDMYVAEVFREPLAVKHGGVLRKLAWPFRVIWNAVGTLGLEPGILANYLQMKFRFVKLKSNRGWDAIARGSTAIITLFKWPGNGGHYVAGIKKKNGRKFRFYNHGFDEKNYRDRYITMARYDRILKKEGCTKLAIIGVGKPKGWGVEILLPW